MAIHRSRTGDTSYSDIVTVSGPGRWAHIAGQLAFDENRRIVGTDVATQTHRCLDRIESLLNDAGGDLSNVVSITVYLTELEHYPEFDRVRAERFPEHRPASAAVKVAGLLFGALIEVAAVAYLAEDG
ncbi:MAG: RidA family protein [Acidimicrobiia bacterium]